MAIFREPMINLYSRDLPRAVAFYQALGFMEIFRWPETGDPVKIELRLDGFTVGIATLEAAKSHYTPREGEGRWIELVFQVDNADAAMAMLTARGAPLLSAPHDFAGGQVRAGWIADPDGNPVQVYQMKR